MKRPIPLVLGAALCLLSLAAGAADWAHRKTIRLDTTPAAADLKQGAAQVPVAVRLHSGNFAFGEAKPDGSDIRFLAADGKTPLKFHLEQYDVPNELGMAWVQVPKLAPGAKTDSIVMEWGNPGAASAADARGTYDAAQVFALHFSEREGVRDATANANHAQASTARRVEAGPLGNALAFSGAERISLAASSSLRVSATQGFTFSVWVKPANAGEGRLLVLGEGAQALAISLAGGTPGIAAGAARATASAALKPALWQHLAVVVGGGKAAFFIDGKEAGGGDFVPADAAGPTVIGDGFAGELDEAGLAATARAADYLRARFAAESAEAPLVVFDEEGGSGESSSYITILLGAVTLDGWIVIGILGVMFVISVWVMAAKTWLLLRAQKTNAAFLTRFKASPRELLSPGHQEIAAVAGDAALKGSPILRIYQIGVDEMRQRFDAQAVEGRARTLSAASLEAIRAAMDAGLLRESQRVNSQIVLLTIAISGGPFLGLLGTVVGVMITFAAIAAAGDVNVNAIAPGIAAALVATVAGLGVAIPALFGYNWLASKIKEVSADAQVFSDEFRTRAAELYSN